GRATMREPKDAGAHRQTSTGVWSPFPTTSSVSTVAQRPAPRILSQSRRKTHRASPASRPCELLSHPTLRSRSSPSRSSTQQDPRKEAASSRVTSPSVIPKSNVRRKNRGRCRSTIESWHGAAAAEITVADALNDPPVGGAKEYSHH